MTRSGGLRDWRGGCGGQGCLLQPGQLTAADHGQIEQAMYGVKATGHVARLRAQVGA